MDDITQKVQARFAELPPDIKQAVESADLDSRIQTIGSKHKLHLDQVGKLQNEVLLVMLGFENTDTFVRNITNVVGVPQPEATNLAADINSEIFNPIRESLKKFTAAAEQAKVSSSTVPAPQPIPTPATPKPQVPLAPHPHDLMLVEKTVTTPPTPPATPPAAASPTTPPPQKPQNYSADPYREPVEP